MTKSKQQKAKAKAQKKSSPNQAASSLSGGNGALVANRGRRDIGAARVFRMPAIGLPSRLRTKIGWVTGTVYAGDGTTGLSGSVYFKMASGKIVADQTGGSVARCWMPAAPTDLNLGQSYMQDIMQHYTRLVIHRARVCLVSLHPSTANDCTVQLACARGPGPAEQGYWQSANLTTVIGAATADILPLPESTRMSVASYESQDLDVTSLVAGGSGARQNEFEINANSADDNGTHVIHPTANTGTKFDLEGVVPFSFIVGGTNSSSGLNGKATHDVVIEYDMELLDFIGGVQLLAPVGVSKPAPLPSTDEADLFREFKELRLKR